jgi:hypothetical protein
MQKYRSRLKNVDSGHIHPSPTPALLNRLKGVNFKQNGSKMTDLKIGLR